MAKLDSIFTAEQMKFAAAGKTESPTLWSVHAIGIQLKKMPFFPWRQYKEFLKKPLIVVTGGFALQYFCNDINAAVQKQGYGVITFIPYIIMFLMVFSVSVGWWVMYFRRLAACQLLETLPRHRQDIQMNETQQLAQDIQDIQMNETPTAEDDQMMNETSKAEDKQMDQTMQGFFIMPEDFCSLMDCWFSTRLGEMSRDEALGKMKYLVEMGNRRSCEISIQSTTDEAQGVMNESLGTRGDRTRHLSAGSPKPACPIVCPRAMESNSQARSLSHDGLVLKIPQNVDVGKLGDTFDANLPGCRELHRRIEIGPEDGNLRETLAAQILRSLRMAWTLDKDSTIQLGSFAIFKYTDEGVKCWMLQEYWTPTILDIHRSTQNFFDVLAGERANWTVRGFNLRNATLRVATAEKTENLSNLHHHKTENGVDVLLFKEPTSPAMSMDGVYISASNLVEVEDGISLKLHSQAIKVQRAFWISVVDAFIPKPWTLVIVGGLSLLAHFFVGCQFAIIVLPVIAATYVYVLQVHIPQQGGDVPSGGLASMVEEMSNVSGSNSRTLPEGKLAEINMRKGKQGHGILHRVRVSVAHEMLHVSTYITDVLANFYPSGDLPVGGSLPLLVDSTSVSKFSATTHAEDKSMKMALPMEEQALEDLVMRKGGRSLEAKRLEGTNTLSDSDLGCIFDHLVNPADRRAVSQVCKQWKEVESNTRKHVQIANCYTIVPATLSRRFPNLKSLKIKGQTRAVEFLLLPVNWANWGVYAAPWIAEVGRAYAHSFESLWLRRMKVTDEDLLLLAQSCPNSLLTLKLERCSGFSPVGLAYITANCRSLKVLCLEDCAVRENNSSSDWLHELAVNNPNLEELNFQYATGLYDIDVNDLEAIVDNCKSLRCLKVCKDVDLVDMERVASRSSCLLELGTGNCAKIGDPRSYPATITFPSAIAALTGLYELRDLAVPLISSVLANLKKLELPYSLLSEEGHCQILRHCVSLEALWTRNSLGDAGLVTVAKTCKNLRRLRIDDSEREGFLSPAGIIPLAESCVELEYLALDVADLNDATMAAIGKNCSVLRDCRLILLPNLPVISGFPLDEGVKSLLSGCQNLTRFALYVRRGALTDEGMGYIGEYGAKLKWILLGCAGESDLGLTRLARGCQSLENLQLRDCPVTESGLVAATVAMKNCLKFLWVQGLDITEAGVRNLARARPNWTVEISHDFTSITSYYSLVEPRRDHPRGVSVLQGEDGEYGTPYPELPEPTLMSPSEGSSQKSQEAGSSSLSIYSTIATRRLIGEAINIASPTIVAKLLFQLKSDDGNLQRQAAFELRRLAKYSVENRFLIANSGAIKPLVALLTAQDLKTQENVVAALLSLSITDHHKSEIAAAGAIDPLIYVLKVGNVQAMENATATLFSLSMMDDNKETIGTSGAIPPLVNVLKNGTPQGKKDAVRALFNLSMFHENKTRIVCAGAIKPLVQLIADPATDMADEAVTVLANLTTLPELGRVGFGAEGGISALVSVITAGSERGKENAAAALLSLCMNSDAFLALVLQEGAIPPLIALLESGTAPAKEKASALLLYLSDHHIREKALQDP